MKLKHGYTLDEVIEFGNERKAKLNLDDYEPDILAEVEYFKGTKDSRETPCTSGYRPAHQVTDEYLTTGEHIYFENDVVWPGESAKVYVKFLSPEIYPHCLWVGKELNVNEASKIVGRLTVKEIYNELLQAANK